MIAGRYFAGQSYDPRMAGGGYRLGAPRNTLAAAYSAPPGSASFGPLGGSDYAGASLSGGTGALSGGTGALSGGSAAMPRGGDGSGAQSGADVDPGIGAQGYGARSTGDFLTDLSLAAPTLGPAAMGMLSGPAGMMGLTAAGLAAGAARGLGYKEAANNIFNASFSSPSSGNLAGMGGAKGTPDGVPSGLTGPGVDDKNAELAGLEFTDELADGAGTGASQDDANSNSMAGTQDAAGPQEGGFGGGAAGLGDQAGVGGTSEDGWRKGGYTGHGGDGVVDPDAEVRGPYHEGEYVVRHEATHHYGPDIMAALNRGEIPKNALAALVAQRRPMQSANHLLQMMRYG